MSFQLCRYSTIMFGMRGNRTRRQRTEHDTLLGCASCVCCFRRSLTRMNIMTTARRFFYRARTQHRRYVSSCQSLICFRPFVRTILHVAILAAGHRTNVIVVKRALSNTCEASKPRRIIHVHAWVSTRADSVKHAIMIRFPARVHISPANPRPSTAHRSARKEHFELITRSNCHSRSRPSPIRVSVTFTSLFATCRILQILK